jgi:hypothetical protein
MPRLEALEKFQYAIFEVHAGAIDRPAARRRWNGDPMPSPEASEALHKAVEAFRESLHESGFTPASLGYGARAEEAKVHLHVD